MPTLHINEVLYLTDADGTVLLVYDPERRCWAGWGRHAAGPHLPAEG